MICRIQGRAIPEEAAILLSDNKTNLDLEHASEAWNQFVESGCEQTMRFWEIYQRIYEV